MRKGKTGSGTKAELGSKNTSAVKGAARGEQSQHGVSDRIGGSPSGLRPVQCPHAGHNGVSNHTKIDLMQIEIGLIRRDMATKTPCLNEGISYKPFL